MSDDDESMMMMMIHRNDAVGDVDCGDVAIANTVTGCNDVG